MKTVSANIKLRLIDMKHIRSCLLNPEKIRWSVEEIVDIIQGNCPETEDAPRVDALNQLRRDLFAASPCPVGHNVIDVDAEVYSNEDWKIIASPLEITTVPLMQWPSNVIIKCQNRDDLRSVNETISLMRGTKRPIAPLFWEYVDACIHDPEMLLVIDVDDSKCVFTTQDNAWTIWNKSAEMNLPNVLNEADSTACKYSSPQDFTEDTPMQTFYHDVNSMLKAIGSNMGLLNLPNQPKVPCFVFSYLMNVRYSHRLGTHSCHYPLSWSVKDEIRQLKIWAKMLAHRKENKSLLESYLKATEGNHRKTNKKFRRQIKYMISILEELKLSLNVKSHQYITYAVVNSLPPSTNPRYIYSWKNEDSEIGTLVIDGSTKNVTCEGLFKQFQLSPTVQRNTLMFVNNDHCCMMSRVFNNQKDN